MATNTKIHYRGSAVPTVVNSTETAANLPLQNTEIDTNFYSLAVSIDAKANATDVTAVAYGGTGSNTASGARTNLGLGTAAVRADSYFQISGSYESPLTFSNGVARVANAIAVTYGSAVNTVCQGNDARLSDARAASGGTAANISGTLAVANGGTNITTYTTGDILYASSTNVLSKLPKASSPDGSVLKLSGGLPSWGSDNTVVPGNAGLTFSIGTAAGSGTAIDVSGSGFTADATVGQTYSVKIGPALSALATAMTGAGSGFIRKNGADSYSFDTSTYLTAAGAVTSFSGGTTGLTPATTTTGAVTLAGTLAIANGGTNLTTYAAGDIIYASALNTLAKLAKGTDGQVLKLSSGLPYWGTDIDTTYANGTGLSLVGTTFSVNYGSSGTTACVGNDGRLSDARVASDVYTWAKAATKPTYTATEVGLGNVANAAQVTAVTGTAPVSVSPGTTPVVSMAAATAGNNGYMTIAYATKLDGIAAGATNVTNTNQLTNGAGYITGVAWGSITGIVPTWNQNTTGNAATATNVAYSGLTGTVPTWNQNTTGNAATASYATSAGSAPASDVYSWAKAASKPSYSQNEIGSAALSATTGTFSGDVTSTGNVTAYYSDDKLKTRLGIIENAVAKIETLDTFYYEANEVAQALGYIPVREVGLSAQQVQKIMPEVVVPAPIDPQYLTIHYERLLALSFAAIKELSARVKQLEGK